MAETPDKDIEKRLREYAQQRRDAAGTPAMHPATRAMLQAEVKQRGGAAGAPSAAAQRSGWALFWPRFAFAFAIVAILGVAAILIVPPGNRPKENFSIAKLDESDSVLIASDKEAAPALAPVPLSAPAEPTGAARREIAPTSATASTPSANLYAVAKSARSDTPPVRTEPMKAFKGGASQNTPTDSAARNLLADSSSTTVTKQEERTASFNAKAKTATGSVLGDGTANPSKSARGGGIAGIQTQAAAPAANVQMRERSIATSGKIDETKSKDLNGVQSRIAGEGFNNLSQRYRNVAATEDLKRSGKITVLDEFTVEQNGESLTVVDRDGSVYNGFARLAGADRQNANVESGNPIQLVTNSGGGGRAGAAMNQITMNRGYVQNQAPGQASQNLGAAQTLQIQNAPELQNYFFRVEGTNRSLNQRVVFVGNMLQNNPVTVQNSGYNQTFRNQQNAPTGNLYNFNNQQLPVQNNIINGRVQLDNSKAVEFNALSVGQ